MNHDWLAIRVMDLNVVVFFQFDSQRILVQSPFFIAFTYSSGPMVVTFFSLLKTSEISGSGSFILTLECMELWDGSIAIGGSCT